MAILKKMDFWQLNSDFGASKIQLRFDTFFSKDYEKVILEELVFRTGFLKFYVKYNSK
jgi:hypothetical protein